jgi:tRNA pseudouridine38-40 synthase
VKRFFLYLGYDGKNYCGWQVQPNGTGVQSVIEHHLSLLLHCPTSITGAGRTDAGVHARLMVAHFDADLQPDDLPRVVERLNGMLPQDIVIYRIMPVRADAHARFDALSRSYQYYIGIGKNPFQRDYVYRLRRLPDIEAMNRAAVKLSDYSDFTAFSKLHTDVKTNNCRIMHAQWTPQPALYEGDSEKWVFTVTADRFLRNMVRAIVGTLLEVGAGKCSLDDFCGIIESKDRRRAGTSVPAHALFLTEIRYPPEIFI